MSAVPKKRASRARKGVAAAVAPSRPEVLTLEMERRLLDGLSRGRPIVLICDAVEMPPATVVWDRLEEDAEFARAVRRAREAGFDRMAMEALAIADEAADDMLETKRGMVVNRECLLRSKLRIDLRMKLLAKWDPQRYGDKVLAVAADGGAGDEGAADFSAEMEERVMAAAARAREVVAPDSLGSSGANSDF